LKKWQGVKRRRRTAEKRKNREAKKHASGGELPKSMPPAGRFSEKKLRKKPLYGASRGKGQATIIYITYCYYE
jgi:hypothetical protein